MSITNRSHITEKELNSVRDLNKEIRNLEKHLQALRLNADNITPVMDGLPHSTDVKNRVKRLALNIADDGECELADLQVQYLA